MENFSVVVKRVSDVHYEWHVDINDPPEECVGSVTFSNDERAAPEFDWQHGSPDNWEDIEEKILDSISTYNRDQTIAEINSSTKKKTHNTQSCEKCNGRTALIKGTFYYDADEEPYNGGVKEDAKIKSGDCWVGGYICDDCGHIQGLWHE